MGIKVNDELQTKFGNQCIGAYFNIGRYPVSIEKDRDGKYQLRTIFTMFNSKADRDAEPPKECLDYCAFESTLDNVPESNLYSLAYDLFKVQQGFVSVVDM